MPTLNPKDLVRQSIQSEWPAFVAEHPRLSAVLDENLLIEQATHALRDDPDYQQAMQTASAMGLATETLASFIRQFVQSWLRQLL